MVALESLHGSVVEEVVESVVEEVVEAVVELLTPDDDEEQRGQHFASHPVRRKAIANGAIIKNKRRIGFI